MLIVPSDITLAMNVTIVRNPITTHTDVPNGHVPWMIVYTANGMLTVHTMRSAVLRHNTRALEVFLKCLEEMITIHKDTFPTKAETQITPRTVASTILSVMLYGADKFVSNEVF